MAGTKPSEFGGGPIQRNGIQPPPHVPDTKERLMLLYRTGDDSGRTPPDNGEAFSGMLPYPVQYAIREAEGVLARGERWDDLQTEASVAIEALAAEQGTTLL